MMNAKDGVKGLLLVGGFCVSALGGPTVDLTSLDSSWHIGLPYFQQIDLQPAPAGFMDMLVGLSADPGAPIYGRDAGRNSWILPDSRLDHGSASADTLACIPHGLFEQTDGGCVCLSSPPGESYPNGAGFDQWAVGASDWLPATPSPAGVVLAGIGVCLVGWLRRWEIL